MIERGYDWSGLRARRAGLIGGVLLLFPGSCVAQAADRGDLTLYAALGVMALSALAIGRWSCPRCSEAFARRADFPWVRPWAPACSDCGLPDFTPSAAVAPPPRSAAEPQISASAAAEQSAYKRMRLVVSLPLVLPLIYMSMCRLPSGAPTVMPSGATVRVLSLVKNTRWTTNSGSGSTLVLTVYGDSVTSDSVREELLALTLPAVTQSGDSTVRLQELRNDWWARAIGLRLSNSRSYRLSDDGSWRRLQ